MKPEPRQHHAPCLDYHECRDFIEEKYDIRTRDFARFKGNPNAPYQDFWHWLLSYHNEISNGSYFTLQTEGNFAFYGEIPDWVRTILGYFVIEFPPKDGGIEFYVWW
jgi:hypothetical protein